MFVGQMSVLELGILAVIAVAFIVVFVFLLVHLKLWFQAFMSQVPISLSEIIKMRFRGVDPTPFVTALIMAQQGGLTLSNAEVEQAYLQGVDALAIVRILVFAAPQHNFAPSADAPRSTASEEAEQHPLKRLWDLKGEVPETTFQKLVDAYLKDKLEEKREQ
jgi:uncharacterized protein YqfA (UPF0365 family)